MIRLKALMLNLFVKSNFSDDCKFYENIEDVILLKNVKTLIKLQIDLNERLVKF